MIKNIAFDFGGVIFDLDYDGAIETFKSIGLADADQRLDRYHQRGFFEDLESGRITPETALRYSIHEEALTRRLELESLL